MESFNGHFKGENRNMFYDQTNIWKSRRGIGMQVECCNGQRRHSAWLCANLPAPSEARQAGTHGQALGYLVPWTYIEQEVRLPEPALDLAQISF
jgi:hypothetical protein